MNTQTMAENLAERIPLLAMLDDETRSGVLAELEFQEYVEGDTVFQQGGKAEQIIWVVDGEFELFTRSESLNFECSLGVCSVGHLLGSSSLISDVVRQETATCRSPGQVAKLTREKFLDALRSHPEACLRLALDLARALERITPSLAVIPFVDLDRTRDYSTQAGLLPAPLSRLLRIMVLEAENGAPTMVALVDPGDRAAQEYIVKTWRHRPKVVAISDADFAWFANGFLKSRIAPIEAREEDLTYANPEQAPGAPPSDASQKLHSLLAQALASGASDLHIEPTAEDTWVRMRVDNLLITLERLPLELCAHLHSRVKVLCDLDITQRRLPQDGSFALRWQSQSLDVRSAFIPVVNGEKCVLRFLPHGLAEKRLEDLILDESLLACVRNLFREPQGLILVTGPTGSGKSSLVYSALQDLWNKDDTISIASIENPVDRKLPFCSQVQVDYQRGLDFPESLRAVLRHDPDVVFVGEIRDRESGQIAAEAAGTGHLVVATLHAGSPAEAIDRLRKLGVEPWLMASVLRGVISTRLVREVRPEARLAQPAPPAMLKELENRKIIPAGWNQPVATVSPDKSEADCESGRLYLLGYLGIWKALRQAIAEGELSGNLPELAGDRHHVAPEDYARILLEQLRVFPNRLLECFPSFGD